MEANNFSDFSNDERYFAMLREIIFQHLDKESYAVFLFGGRTYKKNAKKADVDIGILGKKAVPLNALARLYETVENSTIPYNVDFVDFYSADPKFKELALRNITIWHCPKSITLG